MAFRSWQVGQSGSSMLKAFADVQIVGGEVNQERGRRAHQPCNRPLNGNVPDAVYQKIGALFVAPGL